ncbi:unnamed protein product [Mytilus coruscus]|uniref:SWIM-type domain-containing protein n=1 Tax=Mytilus coruscus TaxID=42192 RepID=A0A6J8CGX7_MYTCO|nr:unnamed protein product [Mytilus coruscus]
MKPKCCVCNIHITKKGHSRKISQQQKQFFETLNKNVIENGIICNKCRQQFYRQSTNCGDTSTDIVTTVPAPVSKLTENKLTPQNESITLPIVTVGKTSRKCCVCVTTKGSFVTMPEKARLHVFVTQGILVPAGVRCCPGHLDGKTLKTGTKINVSRLRKTTSDLNASDIIWLLDRLRGMVSHAKKKRLDFDDPNSLTDEDIVSLTGITKEQFEFLVSSVSKLKKSANRSPRTAIAILLVKLKTGLSHRILENSRRYMPPLITSVEEHCDIARSMLEKSKQPNPLQERVLKDKALSKRAREWVPLYDCKHYDNFPKLTEDYLRSLTFGVYQLYQAPNYADQHLDNDGDIDIFLHTVSSSFVQAKIQSRHTSCKQYCLWLEFNEDNDTHPVNGWFCECKAGARTVGCCAHVATILWYMGHARHTDYKTKTDRYSNAFKDASVDIETGTDLESD